MRRTAVLFFAVVLFGVYIIASHYVATEAETNAAESDFQKKNRAAKDVDSVLPLVDASSPVREPVPKLLGAEIATSDIGTTTNNLPSRANIGQNVHWVFTTDCSVYMWNQGNLLLASALHVQQPGDFTWIMVGCQTQEQKQETLKLAHPRARVWHTPDKRLFHPKSKEPHKTFQASNRPAGIGAWWRETSPTNVAIGILDPDEMFMRAVHLVDAPRSYQGGTDESHRGPWETDAVQPNIANAALYGIGCIPKRWTDQQLRDICGERYDACEREAKDRDACFKSYASGPPWVLHREDAEKVFGAWLDTAILVNDVWPDIFAEQASYGITQMQYGIHSNNHAFWFLSSWNDPYQESLWDVVEKSKYEPCRERVPPPPDEHLPVLWHGCRTYQIPHLEKIGFRLHKDHIHKDLLDCDAPLLQYPPKDALTKYHRGEKSHSFRHTWSVCAYTNLVNAHATSWKTKFCTKPNLRPTFEYPKSCDVIRESREPHKASLPQRWLDGC